MARGRMIDQRFTQSDKLNSVPRDHRLVYASILPYLDRQGRMCAEPMVVKVTAFRRSDFTIEEITDALVSLANAGLIRLYSDKDNEAILEYANFLDFNSPNNRERKSDFPGPDDSGALRVRDELLATALEAPAETRPTDTPRAEHVQGQRGVQGNGTERERLTLNGERKEKDMSADADDSQEPPKPPPLDFDRLAEIWNAHSGNLRKVRDLKAAHDNRELQRLAESFIKRHGARAEEIFTLGIAGVRDDPHWLGRKSKDSRRNGQAYGILNYLRNAEDKYEIALEDAATATGPTTSGKAPPTRPWEEWDIAQPRETGVVEVINQVLPDGTARMQNGETWVLAECDRCNN